MNWLSRETMLRCYQVRIIPNVWCTRYILCSIVYYVERYTVESSARGPPRRFPSSETATRASRRQTQKTMTAARNPSSLLCCVQLCMRPPIPTHTCPGGALGAYIGSIVYAVLSTSRNTRVTNLQTAETSLAYAYVQ